MVNKIWDCVMSILIVVAGYYIGVYLVEVDTDIMKSCCLFYFAGYNVRLWLHRN
jgi:hypothetical protein